MLRELRPGDPRSIGPYLLVGHLGDGGMGRVYLGRSAGGRSVAVKVISGELAADPEFRVRFRREVAAARMVSGLFTAVVVDADAEAPEPWLATAYVQGPSLAEAIAEHGPLPPSSVLALAAGMAESLAAIHAAGVVHRDLKPSNVLLGIDGPCVIDFGISRATEATSVTRAGFVLGSPGYMSPEQAEGDDVGPASDIFSLGAVLAFAATGNPPFGGGSTAALVYRVVHAPARLDGIPAEIRPLIERCLAKEPGQRPTAQELLTEAGAAAQPMERWLPGHITDGFPGISGAAPGHPTITGGSAVVAPTPESVPAELASGPQTDPVVAAVPLPVASLVRTPKHPITRPFVLGPAIALIAIAALVTGLAAGGGGSHHSSRPPVQAAANIPLGTPTPAVPPPTSPAAASQPAASHPAEPAARTTPQSRRPATHPVVIPATSAPATRPATTPATSRAPKPTPKPTPTRTRPAGTSISVSGATEHSCGSEGSLRSVPGAAVQFTFTDNGSSDLQINEIGTDGALESAATLIPGADLTESTNVGAYWVVENSGGGCMVILGISGSGQATIS